MLSRLIFAILFTASCGAEKSNLPKATVDDGPSYRYFDREIYLAKGSSVTPEHTAAQEVVKAALEDLELSTDLGAGYFKIGYEDDSILQPVAVRTQTSGRNWRSFIQTWNDDIINDYLAKSGGDNPDGDQDVIAASNSNNSQQYFVVTRLSCFLAASSCGYASQVQAKMLVWRSFGYLIGLRNGTTAASVIMKPAIDPDQELPEERRKFIAEFNGQLETIKNTKKGSTP